MKSMDSNLEINGSSAAVISVYPADLLGCSCSIGCTNLLFSSFLSLKSVKRSIVNPIEIKFNRGDLAYLVRDVHLVFSFISMLVASSALVETLAPG